MSDGSDDGPDWANYESGPFCRHWYDASDCDIVCATCGHRCIDHGFGDGAESSCQYCACQQWKEPE